jgi:recombination associated protein RdgC
MESKLFKAFTPFIATGSGGMSMSSDATFEDLDEHEAQDPVGSQWRALGFITLDGESFAMDVQGAGTLVCVQVNERVLPGAVIREKVAARIRELEDAEGRRPGKKQIAEIKDDVVMALLPIAFIRRKLVPVLFTEQYVLVFTSSAKLSDDVVSLLMRACPRLPDMRLSNLHAMVKNNIEGALTTLAREGQSAEESVTDEAIDYFVIGNAAVLKGEGKKSIRVKDKSLEDSDMQALLKQDYSVQALRLDFIEAGSNDTSMTFTLNDHLVFSGIVLADVSTATERGEEAKAALFMTTAWMTSITVRRALAAITDVMGGLNADTTSQDAPVPKKQSASALALDEDEEL